VFAAGRATSGPTGLRPALMPGGRMRVNTGRRARVSSIT
jgi:hypothetical protein